MAKRYRHISELTPNDIDLFVHVLCLPPAARHPVDGSPSRQWLARQSEKVAQLPKPLRRPDNWLGRLSVYTNRKLRLTIDDLVPQCAVLCGAHEGLNPWLVHRVFLLLSGEVTRRMDPLRRYLKDPAKYGHDDHDEDNSGIAGVIRAYVDRMNGLLSLWTGPDVLARVVGGEVASYPEGLAVPRVRSDCEACIVACVGARGQALCDLRAMMRGRSRRKGRAPVLLRLVEAWIGRFGEGGVERLMGESEYMAGVVRSVRRKVVNRRGNGHRHGRHAHHHRHHHHRTPFEKRERECVRMERDPDSQKLSASQRRVALGEIDTKLDETFAGESRQKDRHQGKHPSSLAITSSATFPSNALPANIVKPRSRHNNDFMPVDNHQQTYRSSWKDYSYIVDQSCGQDGEGDIEPFPDYDNDYDNDNDNEFDEADPDATHRLQDQVQSWYERYTEIGANPSAGKTEVNSYAHPAFRQKVADIEGHFARSQMAISAMPSPLHIRRDFAPADGEYDYNDDDDDDDKDWVPAAACTEASQWTDVSVHTLATQSTHKNGRVAGRPQSKAPPVPGVPSMYRDGGATASTAIAVGQDREDPASMIVGLVPDVTGPKRSSGAYGLVTPSPPSSVYSNDAPTAAHPSPAATTVVPAAVAYLSPPRPGDYNGRSLEPPAVRSIGGNVFENPRTPPRVPGPWHRRGQPGGMIRGTPGAPASDVTQWPSPYGTSGRSSGSRHRHRYHKDSSSSSSTTRTTTLDTTLSGREFQAMLNCKARLPGVGAASGGHPAGSTSTSTILPDDSVSVAGQFCPPEEPGVVVHRYQLRQDQVLANEALSRDS